MNGGIPMNKKAEKAKAVANSVYLYLTGSRLVNNSKYRTPDTPWSNANIKQKAYTITTDPELMAKYIGRMKHKDHAVPILKTDLILVLLAKTAPTI